MSLNFGRFAFLQLTAQELESATGLGCCLFFMNFIVDKSRSEEGRGARVGRCTSNCRFLIPSSAYLLRPDHLMLLLPCPPTTRRGSAVLIILPLLFYIRYSSRSQGANQKTTHPVHCYLSVQLTKVHFRILSLCMLSILGLYGMHFANIRQTPNSISRNLLIDVHIMP